MEEAKSNYLVSYQASLNDEAISGRTFVHFEYCPPRAQDVIELEDSIEQTTGYDSVFVTGLYKLTESED